MTILYTKANEEDGIAARVAARVDGQFAVTLADTDSGDVFPVVFIFSTEAAAVAKADEIAAGKPTAGRDVGVFI